jgi:hypothetical protein
MMMMRVVKLRSMHSKRGFATGTNEDDLNSLELLPRKN